MYKEIEGDLIALSLGGKFDVIAHGANCFCTMQAGIAVAMAKIFGCDTFELENKKYKGDIDKLGRINYRLFMRKPGEIEPFSSDIRDFKKEENDLAIVNCYSQFWYGLTPNGKAPFDYPAFTLCMRKINHIFKGKHVGLPAIGSGLAGGNWDIIKAIIMEELKDVDVTVVIYNK
jgi:O-acetyl-ADP-ribose deacetylase (regulator of RNase III)